jgi:hypothetical protein
VNCFRLTRKSKLDKLGGEHQYLLGKQSMSQQFTFRLTASIAMLVAVGALSKQLAAVESAAQWQAVELEFRSQREYENPYTEVELWVEFTHEDGQQLKRPGFWDGGGLFKVRFASPLAAGTWKWKSFCNQSDEGLQDQSGSFDAIAGESDLPFHEHGFWRIALGSRWLEYADGTSALMVADTPWALPWRATHAEVEIYAKDRQAKGFNAALLMSVMPDRDMDGPRDRTQHFGFARGFEDLPLGHINEINPEYFQYLDRSVEILVEHGIAPVWQPVFHGYGWRGLRVAGPVIPPNEYARYCRYLVARYGAYPAMWLVLGDGSGSEPGIDAGGREIETWDAYRQPTGLHYGPHHAAQAHQDKYWLDFQWIQTGHNGEHRQDRLASHWHIAPIKAVANGEPTYENIGSRGKAAGWWQGHEAWRNLCAGGTMGIVYGAGSLWNWVHPGEPTQNDAWARAQTSSWQEALEFEGSKYAGLLGRILYGLPIKGAQPDSTCTYGRPALFKPYELLILYLEDGGDLRLLRDDIPDAWRIYDPKTGESLRSGTLQDSGMDLGDTGKGPRVIIFSSTY